jgi:ribosomal protein S27E
MMSASIERKVRLLPQAESKLLSAFQAKLCELRRVVCEDLGCQHNELVFDEVNDVSCKHCGKDFTG